MVQQVRDPAVAWVCSLAGELPYAATVAKTINFAWIFVFIVQSTAQQ